MAAPKRRSVAERNAAAIAQEVVPPTKPQVREPEPPGREEVVSAAASTEKKPKPAARVAAKREDDRKVFGVYLTAEMYHDMKAAYLADWSNRRGEADTLGLWVEAALKAHAARTVEQRAALAAPRVRGEARAASRPFKVDSDVYGQAQRAIGQDQSAGRWLSESAWSVEALGVAIAEAKAANGDVLPEPPARLPNRLKHRE